MPDALPYRRYGRPSSSAAQPSSEIDVNALARAIALRIQPTLTDEDLSALADVLDRRRSVPPLLSTARLAEQLTLSEDWVRAHAAELGGVRMGDGTRGELRFEVRKVNAALERRRLTVPQPKPHRRRPGPRHKRVGEDFELLESRWGEGGPIS